MSLLVTGEWSQSTWFIPGRTVCWPLHQDKSFGEVLWIMNFSGIELSLSETQGGSGEHWITSGNPTSNIYTCFSEWNQEFAGLQEPLWAHSKVAIIWWGNGTNSWQFGITRPAKLQGVNPPECPAIQRAKHAKSIPAFKSQPGSWKRSKQTFKRGITSWARTFPASSRWIIWKPFRQNSDGETENTFCKIWYNQSPYSDNWAHDTVAEFKWLSTPGEF